MANELRKFLSPSFSRACLDRIEIENALIVTLNSLLLKAFELITRGSCAGEGCQLCREFYGQMKLSSNSLQNDDSQNCERVHECLELDPDLTSQRAICTN